MGKRDKTHVSIPYEQLYQLYIVEHQTTVQIAERFNTHETTVYRRLLKYGIDVRPKTIANTGKKFSAETRAKMSAGCMGNTKWLGKKHTQEAKDKLRVIHTGMAIPKQTRDRMSQSHKANFESPEYKARFLTNTRSNQHVSPNNKEILLGSILESVAPGEWRFVGNTDFKVGDRTPDFVSTTGKKKLIEHFGVYWHGERARNPYETEEGRIGYFKERGYDTLIVWEVELLRQPEIVKQRIMEFMLGA